MKLLTMLLVPALYIIVVVSPSIESATADRASAGNSVYRVFAEVDPAEGDAGTFAISTGPDHPAGAGLSILYPGEDESVNPGSYITVRSFTTGTDYVQSSAQPTSGNLIVALDEYADAEAIQQTGYRTTYELPGPPDSAESLRIVSDINVNGESYADSSVELTVTVTNLDVVPISIGIRYALDLQVAGDDGPLLIPVGPNGAAVGDEASFPGPAFGAIRAEDNSATGSQLSVLASVAGDYLGIAPPTSQSELLHYAYWPEAELAAFDYTTSIRDISKPLGLDDAALLLYFGATAEDAILLEPNESTMVSVSMFATAPITGSEICDNDVDDDGDRLSDSEDGDCQESDTPLPSPTPAITPAALPPTGNGASSQRFPLAISAAIALICATAALSTLAVRCPSSKYP